MFTQLSKSHIAVVSPPEQGIEWRGLENLVRTVIIIFQHPRVPAIQVASVLLQSMQKINKFFFIMHIR